MRYKRERDAVSNTRTRIDLAESGNNTFLNLYSFNGTFIPTVD